MKELTLEKALENLNHLDAFKLVVNELKLRYDDAIDDLVSAAPEELQKYTGKIATYREVLDLLSGQ